MRHTTYWYETDIKKEWPLSANAAEEEPPRDDEPFDYNGKPQKFYFEVETDGSLGPQEVVMKVGLESLLFFFPVERGPLQQIYHRVLQSCKPSLPISSLDSSLTQMIWTLLVAMAVRSFQWRRMVPLQSRGQLGGDKRLLLLPLDGGEHRHRRLVVVVAVGEALRPVEVEAPGGVQVQVLGHPGHPPQQGDGVLTQRQLARGVQEAAAGEPAAAQLETPGGVAPMRRRKAAGTCDAYYHLGGCTLITHTYDQRFPYCRKQ